MIWWSPDDSTIPHLSPHTSTSPFTWSITWTTWGWTVTTHWPRPVGFLLGSLGSLYYNQPKKWGYHSWLPYFCGRHDELKLPTPPKKDDTLWKMDVFDFSTFTSNLPKQGSWTHFFREDCPCDFCKSKWCHEFRKNSPLNSHVNMGFSTMSAPQKSKS